MKKEFDLLNNRNKTIRGDIYEYSKDLIVIFVHGFTSERTSRGRFIDVVNELNKLNISSLLFDMPGCGVSDEDIITIKNEKDDLNKIINYSRELGYKNIIICGHSMGTSITLELLSDLNTFSDILGLVLSGVPTSAINYDWNMYYSEDQLNDLNTKGYLLDIRKDKTYKIAKETIDYFATIDQHKLLSNISQPIYLINGDSDYEEEIFVKDNKEASKKYLNVTHKIIKGADHSFKNYEKELKDTIVSYILEIE